MQRILSEPFETVPPGAPGCLAARLRAIMAAGAAPQDAGVFIRRETAAMRRGGYRYWPCGSGILQDRLRGAAPEVLLTKGELDFSVPRVAIVGPRRPDDYGAGMAAAFASTLAQRGVIIVSGGAAGIDSIAHESALGSGGRTVCVLGSGFDEPHPPSNAALFERIGRTGGCCVVSEYSPDMPAQPRFFPERNRIVAALSDAVIVIQAGFGSGALITARLALDIKVPVFVVPADIHWTGSEGSNDLLGRGAVALCRPTDLCVVPALAGAGLPAAWKRTLRRPAGWGSPWFTARGGSGVVETSPGALALLDLVLARHAETGAGAGFDYLVDNGHLSAAMAQTLLLELELAGAVRRIPGGAIWPTADE